MNISINASRGFFNPKNKILHKTLSINCIPKNIIAVFAFLIHTRYNEIPISRNKVIHTGENNQPGGLNETLFNVEYQVDIEEAVNIEPITPAN